MWSTSGSAATYPTVTPAYVTGYAGKLIFRLDPNSRIVYVTGYWAATITPSPQVANMFTAPLPVAFRPLEGFALVQVQGNYTLSLNPDGTSPTGSAQNSNSNVFRAFYYTDTIPA